MNCLTFIPSVFLLLGLSSSWSLGATDLDQLSTEQAQEMMKSASVDKKQFVQAALIAHRLDLIELCNQDNHYAKTLLEAVREMPESTYREQLVLILLTSRTDLWPPDSQALSDGPRQIREFNDPWLTIYEPMVKKYLPHVDTRFEAEIMDSKSRLTLVGQFEAAMKNANVVLEKWRTPPANSQAPQAQTSASPSPKANATLQQETSINSNPSQSPQAAPSPRHFLWLGGGALAVIVMAWMALKKRR